MVSIGSGAKRQIEDIILSRYACYLIVMNGDPRKEVIAVGQTYFAVKARQQELIENYDELSEDQRRMAVRAEMKKHNKSLAEAAQMAGVTTSLDFAIFHNSGYQGLYGGMGKREIAAKKGLAPSADILDHMGSTELAANLFRATQTEEKLCRDKIRVYEDTTKTSTTRYIKLPQETMTLLREYRQWYLEEQIKSGDRWQDSGFVFVKDNGEAIHPDSLTDWLSKFAKRHELPHIHPHQFRHTMASLLYFNGLDSITISKRLGHAKVSTTTDIYSHIIKQADERASECIADAVFRKKA